MAVKKKIVHRKACQVALEGLSKHNLDPILPKIYASRAVSSIDEVHYTLKHLIPFSELQGVEAAAQLVFKFAERSASIVIIGDFDTDGATGVAVMMLAMQRFGFKNVNFVVPNRFEHGYGVSREVIDLAIDRYQPELIITVDSGIKDIEGIAYANEQDIQVIVTDHHIPGDQLPDAAVIVNPNAPDNEAFKSKAMAGVTVAFYVMLGLRALLRANNWFELNDLTDPNMAELIDLVALGTVADVVPLDQNNRTLVFQGLMRIQKGQACVALKALFAVAQRNIRDASSSDLGFAIAPHINAAGRLEDIEVGIRLLITHEAETADILAAKLHDLNIERRQIELGMQKEALEIVKSFVSGEQSMPEGLCLYDPNWHQGIIGILASRMKDQFLKPTIILTQHDEDELKGSARSIGDYDIRAMIASIAEKHPEIVLKHGGHRSAAGLTIKRSGFDVFKAEFEALAESMRTEGLEDIQIETDGMLSDDRLTLDVAKMIREAGPWGQAFPEPCFDGVFNIVEQRIVGQRHLKLGLQPMNGYDLINAIAFNIDLKEWPNESCHTAKIVYRLDVNEYRGMSQVQLIVLYIEPVDSAVLSDSNRS